MYNNDSYTHGYHDNLQQSWDYLTLAKLQWKIFCEQVLMSFMCTMLHIYTLHMPHATCAVTIIFFTKRCYQLAFERPTRSPNSLHMLHVGFRNLIFTSFMKTTVKKWKFGGTSVRRIKETCQTVICHLATFILAVQYTLSCFEGQLVVKFTIFVEMYYQHSELLQ